MTDLYGCHNKPLPTTGKTYVAQSGWSETFRDGFGAPCRVPVYVDVPHVMSTECRYDASATDRMCAGCGHAPHLRQQAAAQPTPEFITCPWCHTPDACKAQSSCAASDPVGKRTKAVINRPWRKDEQVDDRWLFLVGERAPRLAA